jgi:hypothetical protein
MSGVIDDNGIQWEHCNSCGKFVEIDHLFYEYPNNVNLNGRDLCEDCCAFLTYIVIEKRGKQLFYHIDEDLVKVANFLE